MTNTSTITKYTRKIVVVFDICSSTTILENLLYNEHQTKWRNLIISLKRFLAAQSEKLGFEIYKFVGDGWILMFPDNFNGLDLVDFLFDLCERYKKHYKRVEPFLSCDVGTIGLTIGMDKGTVIYLVMNGEREYIGKPINIAARLQSAIKDRDRNPENKVLISRSLFSDFTNETQEEIKEYYDTFNVKRNLRNVSNGENFRCVKVNLI